MPNKPQEIQIADNIAGAEYTNNAFISHPNKDEFHLVFTNVSGNTGKVVSKVITTPGHMKRLVAAMNENLKKYEESYGEIKDIPNVGQEIGFKS
jgi:hypothetical protein